MSWMERKAKREQAQALIAKAGGILENAAKIEKRELTEDENREFDQLHNDAENLLAEVQQVERQLDAEKSFEERIVENHSNNMKEKLRVDRWHHFAATRRPSEALELYLDGTFTGSVETPENATVGFSSGNHSYVGRWNNGAGFVGNIQEVRHFPIGKNDNYFAAEKASFCSANFVLESELIDEAVFE